MPELVGADEDPADMPLKLKDASITNSIDSLKKYFKDEMTNADWKLIIKMKTVFSII